MGDVGGQASENRCPGSGGKADDGEECGSVLRRWLLLGLASVSSCCFFGASIIEPSKADMCAAQPHVRFTLDSARKSGLLHKAMSALPPKADMCSARGYVRFGPIADSCSATKKAVIRSLRRRGRAAWATLSIPVLSRSSS